LIVPFLSTGEMKFFVFWSTGRPLQFAAGLRRSDVLPDRLRRPGEKGNKHLTAYAFSVISRPGIRNMDGV
jgi:hypothetical protein